jgi:hypothetical protein
MLKGANVERVLNSMAELRIDRVDRKEQVSKLPSDWAELHFWYKGAHENLTLICHPLKLLTEASDEYRKSNRLFSTQVAFFHNNTSIPANKAACQCQDLTIHLKVADVVCKFVCGESTIPVRCKPFWTLKAVFAGQAASKWRRLVDSFPHSVDFDFFDEKRVWIDPKTLILELGEDREIFVGGSGSFRFCLPRNKTGNVPLSHWMRVIEMKRVFGS